MVLQEMNTDITVINELGKEKKIEVLIKMNFTSVDFQSFTVFLIKVSTVYNLTLTSFL